MLTRRLQVLLDEGRWERLKARSASSGASVGEIVRRALDDALPADVPDPARAAEQLLAAPPIAVEEWPAMKRELTDARGSGS